VFSRDPRKTFGSSAPVLDRLIVEELNLLRRRRVIIRGRPEPELAIPKPGCTKCQTNQVQAPRNGRCHGLAGKRDIKQIDRIVKEEGLTQGQRELLHRAITREEYSLEEIREIAREIKDLYPNK
jgi:hypothetical protein